VKARNTNRTEITETKRIPVDLIALCGEIFFRLRPEAAAGFATATPVYIVDAGLPSRLNGGMKPPLLQGALPLPHVRRFSW